MNILRERLLFSVISFYMDVIYLTLYVMYKACEEDGFHVHSTVKNIIVLLSLLII